MILPKGAGGKIERLYVIGAGASYPYGIPTLKTLTWDLCNFLGKNDRRIFLDAIYECTGIDMKAAKDSPDFESLLDRLDPRALAYLTSDKAREIRLQAVEIALRGLREFINEKCSDAATKDGPYERLVDSLSERDAIVCFNWDVLPELAFRRNAKPFSYWEEGDGNVLLKPHGSINWFALLDRELLSVDVGSTNWDVFGHNLQYYLLFLKDPLGSKDLGKSSAFVRIALAGVPAIVPPIASKMLSVGGVPRDGFVESGHEGAMRLIWKTFEGFTTTATQLVIIGYSLPGTDAASISVLRNFAPDAAAQRRKKVMIVDTNPAVVDRYRRLVHPDAKLICDDFSSFDPASV
jgi:hypothetical protein